jgi:hypothetical protein
MASLLVQAGMFWAMVVGLPLGITAAVMLLWRFRRRVAQSMREAARTPSARTLARESPKIGAPPPFEQGPAKESLAIELARPEQVLAGAAATSPAAAAKRQAWRVALVYAVAVAVAVLIMANILRFVSSAAPPPERVILWYFLYFAAFSLVFATPAVLAATYVIRKQVRYLVLAVLGLLLVISMWDLFMFKGGLVNLWLWYSAVPAIIALLLSMRRLRAVGPAVIVATVAWTAISFGLMTGFVLYSIDFLGVRFIRPDLQDLNIFAAFLKYIPENFQGPPEEWLHRFYQVDQLLSDDLHGGGRVFTVEREIPENALNILTDAMLFIALAGGALAAWAIVSWLGSRYRRRRASDQMQTIDVMVLVFSLYLFTVSASFSLGIERGSSFDRHWAAAALLAVIAFIAYKLASAEGLRLLRKAGNREPPQTLLLLRVFGFDRRAQRLLEDLGQWWRYLGPIRLIAGTDLAYATVEPHEFYDFLSGRLSRAFIKDQDDLESRLSNPTSAVWAPPAAEGRGNAELFAIAVTMWC